MPVCELSGTDTREDTEKGIWLVQVVEATTVEPGFSAKVRFRLVHPQTLEPLLKPTQFLADLDIFAIAAVTNENGSFRPHLPNNDVVCKTFLRGDILGEARPLAEVKFISDTDTVFTVANTPPPKKPQKPGEVINSQGHS